MDWQQVERESRLLIDEDFSWSEPAQRRRRRAGEEEPIRSRRRPARTAYEPEPLVARAPEAYDSRERRGRGEAHSLAETHTLTEAPDPTDVHSRFDEMMEQWTAVYGEPAGDVFDLSDPGSPSSAQGSRRTVVITGRGDQRYMPAPRRRPSAELRFHERSTFSPDRAGLWAVLLGIALLIGCIAH